MNKTRSLLFFAGAALLLSMSVPTASMAADAFKDVVVRNTTANPVPVKVTDEPRQLRHGHALIGPPEGGGSRATAVPSDLVLTDAVITRVSGNAEVCNVVLAEDKGGVLGSLAHLFPTIQDGSRALQFLSGIEVTADRLLFVVNNDCYVHVLWSGYTKPTTR